MTEFKPGTKVRVEFEAVVEEPRVYDYIKADSGGLHCNSDWGGGFLKVRDTKGGVYHYVWTGPEYYGGQEVVTAIVPTDWEKYDGVQVGDIWEANGREYFAYKTAWGLVPTLYPVDGSGAAYYDTNDKHGAFGKLNPRLLRRRGESI